MKKVFTFLVLVVVLVLGTGCTEADGRYVRPPASANWLDVPVTSSLALGLNLGGMEIVQFNQSDAVTISVPGVVGVYTFKPKDNGYELVQGLKSWTEFRNAGDLPMQLEFAGDRKIVVRKNPADPKRWQLYQP